MNIRCSLFALACALPSLVSAQAAVAPTATTPMSVAGSVTLPPNTMVEVTPVVEITSKKMKEGDKVAFQVVKDVVHNGAVVIPRGAPLQSTITWRTGKGIGGKSAKYDVTFDSVSVAGHEYKLRGKHRQEGKGNTVAALLGSILISGRSAVMVPGQIVNVFTAEPISS